MAQRTAVFGSSSGLHSRPAATLARAAAASKHTVTLAAGDTSVDARSILALLQLGVNTGDEVALEVDGPEADRVADELQALLEQDLDAA
ncbi:HPr family phosphocarrier protein [Microbacterium hydrothermale]|uniref:HPr family phosphocarrier protein n=1 Tax=Microbacterium hydrothermale TaxID=857427 RepID=UPI0010A88037|nr:HPr family phosphocarrier protein [Microbacterium hydrothermale]